MTRKFLPHRRAQVVIRFAYSYRATPGVLEVHRFEVDAPGLAQITIRGRIEGVTGAEGEDPDSARLDHMDMSIVDEGLIRRLDSSIAAKRRTATGGQLLARYGPQPTRLLTPLRKFLGGHAPQRIQIRIRPPDPVTIDECLALTPAPARAVSILGISILRSLR